jgi:hypothetical protein
MITTQRPPERFQAAGQRPSELLQADEFAAPRWIDWWYRLCAPRPPVGRGATLRERERVRRGRLASIILAVQLFGIELPVIPVVAHAPNASVVLPWLAGCIVALLAAFVLNRSGKLTLAGLCIVASIEVTVRILILTIPGGITVFYLPQFDILVQPILIAVSLLAPWSAFAVAGLNVMFILLALLIGPHAPDLVQVLHNPAQMGDLFSVPILTQLLSAFFSFLVVRNLLDTLKRVDRAEQVASLEYMLAESRKQAEARNHELEQGIAAMVSAIRLVAAGHPNTPIALPHGHVLWPITTQLSQIFTRYHKLREADAQLDAITTAISELTNELYQASLEQRPPRLHRRRTPLDGLIIALSTMTLPEKATIANTVTERNSAR